MPPRKDQGENGNDKDSEEILITPAKMKVAELKEALSARGLSPKGLKKELVERLEKALESTKRPSTLREQVLLPVERDSDQEEEEEPVATPTKKQKTKDSSAKELTVSVEEELPTPILEASAEIPIEEDVGPRENLQIQPPELQSNEILLAHPPHHSESKLTIVHITNLVRPFTVPSLRGLMSQFGTINDLWLDSLKSQCLVQYNNHDEAQNCLDKINGLKWPVEIGRILHAGLTSVETMKAIRSAEEAPKEPAVTTQGPLILDKLFHKTISEPPLYYLPASPLEDI